MAERLLSPVKATVGFASETGPRERNEDFGGAVFGYELPKPRRDIVAAVADGIGGARGGRVASETAVRGFLDGFCDMPETMEVRRAAARRSQFAQQLDLCARQDATASSTGMGLHLHRARAARAHRACLRSMSARLAPIGLRRQSPGALDHRPRARKHRPRADRTFSIARSAWKPSCGSTMPRPAGGAARPLLIVQRRRARLSDAGSYRRHFCASVPPPTTLRAPSIAAALQSGEQHRQLHRARRRRGRSADGRNRRSRRRYHAAAADPDADRRPDRRWLRAQSADSRTAAYTRLFRRFRRGRRRRSGAEISQASRIRRGRHLSCRLRARSLGRRAHQQSLCRARHRIAAGARRPASTP